LRESFINYLEDKKLKDLLSNAHLSAEFSLRYQNQLEPLKVNHKKRARPVFTKRKKRNSYYKVDKLLGLPIDLDKFWISSYFGPRRVGKNKEMSFHFGLDMAAIKGTKVFASETGKITVASYLPGFGNNIIINHANNLKTRYAHLNSIFVRAGQHVSRGQLIGTVGDSGCVRKKGHDASHLHFELYNNGRRVNPLAYLPI
jgi:murein DD-endopeptidase MepM/ murein hydrolase activator NlpD